MFGVFFDLIKSEVLSHYVYALSTEIIGMHFMNIGYFFGKSDGSQTTCWKGIKNGYALVVEYFLLVGFYYVYCYSSVEFLYWIVKCFFYKLGSFAICFYICGIYFGLSFSNVIQTIICFFFHLFFYFPFNYIVFYRYYIIYIFFISLY